MTRLAPHEGDAIKAQARCSTDACCMRHPRACKASREMASKLNATTCDQIRPLSERLHLFSLLTTSSHILLVHWLRHYEDIGVRLASNTAIVLDRHDQASDAAALATLRSFAVGNVSLLPIGQHMTPDVKLEHVNSYLAGLPETALLIVADVDEFFTYPCDAAPMMQQGQTAALCATMMDRITNEFLPAPVLPSRSLSNQFPVCVPWRQSQWGHGTSSHARAKTTKITLLAVRIQGKRPWFVDSHAARVSRAAESGPPVKVGGPFKSGCRDTGYFSHFTFVAQRADIYTNESRRRGGTKTFDHPMKAIMLSEEERARMRRLARRPCAMWMGLDPTAVNETSALWAPSRAHSVPLTLRRPQRSVAQRDPAALHGQKRARAV